MLQERVSFIQTNRRGYPSAVSGLRKYCGTHGRGENGGGCEERSNNPLQELTHFFLFFSFTGIFFLTLKWFKHKAIALSNAEWSGQLATTLGGCTADHLLACHDTELYFVSNSQKSFDHQFRE